MFESWTWSTVATPAAQMLNVIDPMVIYALALGIAGWVIYLAVSFVRVTGNRSLGQGGSRLSRSNAEHRELVRAGRQSRKAGGSVVRVDSGGATVTNNVDTASGSAVADTVATWSTNSSTSTG